MKDILSLIPYEVNDYVKSLIEGQDLIIRTVPKRRTKHGDYRKLNNKHIIKIATIESMKHYTSFRIIKYILKYF